MIRSLACCLIWLACPTRPAQAQNAPAADFLTPFEAAVAREQNLARTSPGTYAELLADLRGRYAGTLLRRPGLPAERTREGVAALDEAIAFLRSVEPLPPLRISAGMSAGARDHVADQGPRGTVGHVGSDSSQVWDRLSRYGRWLRSVGENIAYGPGFTTIAARVVVTQLIVDDGVPDRGHREAMYDQRFAVAGVACGTHATYQHMCVLTYAADYREN